MAEWVYVKDVKGYEMDSKFEDIQSLFLSGKINKMYQLLERSPTKIAQLLGLNYDSYHDKLRNPEKFTFLHIYTLSYAINVDPDIITNVIQKEISEKVRSKFKAFVTKNK